MNFKSDMNLEKNEVKPCSAILLKNRFSFWHHSKILVGTQSITIKKLMHIF